MTFLRRQGWVLGLRRKGENLASLWGKDGLYVDAVVDESGALKISGQDLKTVPFGGDEYEYFITVAAEDVALVVHALGGKPGSNVLELLRANAQMLVETGETKWLRSNGIKHEFSSWY